MSRSTETGSVWLLVAALAGSAGAVSIETVPVGDRGNVTDTRYSQWHPVSGSVGYAYNIGKYEVTAGQYTEFLNKVAATDSYQLYDTRMWFEPTGCKIRRSGTPGSYTYAVDSDYSHRPVNFVSYWDACRFANWLHNDQPSGDQGPYTTETGAYTLEGYNGTEGLSIERDAGWKWAVPSEDEWHKAAYYKGGSKDAGYWEYPYRSNNAPGRDLADASGNNTNWHLFTGTYPIDGDKYTTLVGEFQNSISPYGTFDQGGNVAEWNESIRYLVDDHWRAIRGGSFRDADSRANAGARSFTYSSYSYDFTGFRVVQLPEATTMLMLAAVCAGARPRRRR